MNLLKSTLLYTGIFLMCLLSLATHAQTDSDEDVHVLQLSGQIVYDEDNQLKPLVYANIGVKGTSRGTYSDMNGFFSLAVRITDTLMITYQGFDDLVYAVPDSLTDNRYSIILLLSQDTDNFLPVVQIYPRPSKEHFDIEFAAMDVSDEMTERAEENLEEEKMVRMRDELDADGSENFQYRQAQRQANNYAAGQYKPMQILNPLAWSKFIKEWKSGKYKKKKN